jgi:hypothetical protein
MIAIGDYFTQTPGIGGFDEHVIILHTPFCVLNNLLTLNDFRAKLVSSFFYESAALSVFSSHNVAEFRAPFVVVHVTGKSEFLVVKFWVILPRNEIPRIAYTRLMY